MTEELDDKVRRAQRKFIEREQAMRYSFDEQADKLPEQVVDERHAKTVGLETEYVVVDENGPVTVDEAVRHTEHSTVELGASQLELVSDPLDGHPQDLADHIRQIEAAFDQRNASKQRRREPVNNRISPNEVETTDRPKYKIVPQYFDKHQTLLLPQLFADHDFTDPRCVGLFQGLHANAQAESLDDAITMLNNAYEFTPALYAISGRDQEGKGIGIWPHVNDIRPLAWEATHDTRTLTDIRQGEPSRFGLPESYMGGWEDYAIMVRDTPFIINDADKEDAALDIALGMDWHDARLKFEDGKPIVEARSAPIQASPRDDAMFGVVAAATMKANRSDRHPMQDIHQQRRWALYSGGLLDQERHGRTYKQDFRHAVESGLAHYGIRGEDKDRVMSWLERRL
jgi:hypothetical protein